MERTPQNLTELYVNQELTAREIAPLIGCSPRTVVRDLHRFGILVRNPGIIANPFLQDRKWLYRQYIIDGKSTIAIAKQINATPRTVLSALNRFGIATRDRNQHSGRKWSKEVRQKMSLGKKGMYIGKNNPNWKGGLVSDRVRERRSYKAIKWAKDVKDRDNWTCQDCGATENLHSHHIKEWQEYPDLRYCLDNGKTVCAECHLTYHPHGIDEWSMSIKYKAPRAQSTRVKI